MKFPLRRIEQTTGVRRETASGYLKAAGVVLRPPRGCGPLRANPANQLAQPAPEGVELHPSRAVPLAGIAVTIIGRISSDH